MAGATFAGPIREAHAILALAADVGSGAALVFAVDNNVIPAGYTPGAGYVQLIDQDPTVGILSLGTAPVIVDGLSVSGSLHEQTIASSPGDFNILSSSSLEVENISGSAVTVELAVSGTDYTPPVTQAFTTGSGTWVTAGGSTIELNWYNDPLNGQGAETGTDAPGGLVDTFSDTAGPVLDSFSHTGGPFAVSDLDPFSMTLRVTATLAVGGSLISRGQSEVKPLAVVPEPGTLAMAFMAVPLMGVGYRLRRRRCELV